MSRRSASMSLVSCLMSLRSWHVSQGGVVLCAQTVTHEASSSAADIRTRFVNDFLISFRFPLLKDFGFGPRRDSFSPQVRLSKSPPKSRRRDTPLPRADAHILPASRRGAVQARFGCFRVFRRTRHARGRTFSRPHGRPISTSAPFALPFGPHGGSPTVREGVSETVTPSLTVGLPPRT